MTEEKKNRLEWWKLILGSIVAIIGVLVPLVWSSINSENTPQFGLASPIFSPKSTVNIYARNDSAHRDEDLHIEWDGLLFHHGATFSQKSIVKYSWVFTPGELIKDVKLLSDGQHKIRFGFNNSKLSDPLHILLTEQKLVTVPPGRKSAIEKSSNGERRALVIGNSNYSDIPLFGYQDAKLIAQRLNKSGFNVTLAANLTESQFRQTIANYKNELDESDTFVFYYAGHGVNLDGTNYLIPIDFTITDARDIELHGIPMSQIHELTNKLQNNITFYASQPGRYAIDALPWVDNSPFATALADNWATPNAELTKTFRKVIQDVNQATRGEQVPWLISNASTKIILNNSNGDSTTETKGQSASILLLDTSTTPLAPDGYYRR